MENNIYKELPYFLASNNYRPALKISRRRIIQHTNISNYLRLIEKTNLDPTYFYSDNIQKIMKNSIKLK